MIDTIFRAEAVAHDIDRKLGRLLEESNFHLVARGSSCAFIGQAGGLLGHARGVSGHAQTSATAPKAGTPTDSSKRTV